MLMIGSSDLEIVGIGPDDRHDSRTLRKLEDVVALLYVGFALEEVRDSDSHVRSAHAMMDRPWAAFAAACYEFLEAAENRPLVICEGDQIPPGGALLTYYSPSPENEITEWYRSLDAAKRALVTLAERYGATVDAGGLNADMTVAGAQYESRAWITRRIASPDPVCAECGKAFEGGPTEETHKGRCHFSCARGRRFVTSAGNR